MKSLANNEAIPESVRFAITKTLETYNNYRGYLVYRPPDQPEGVVEVQSDALSRPLNMLVVVLSMMA